MTKPEILGELNEHEIKLLKVRQANIFDLKTKVYDAQLAFEHAQKVASEAIQALQKQEAETQVILSTFGATRGIEGAYAVTPDWKLERR